MKYFAYDPEGEGFQFYDSLDKAREFAKNTIPEYLDECWDEDGVRQICTGVILHRAELTTQIPRPPDDELNGEGYGPDGHYWGIPGECMVDYDEIWNFTLEPQSVPDDVLALIPTADLVAELSRRESVELIERSHPGEGTFVKGPCKILVVKG